MCIIVLLAAFRRREHCGHKGMDIVNNNTQIGCAALMMPIGIKEPKVRQENGQKPELLSCCFFQISKCCRGNQDSSDQPKFF